MSPGEDKSMRDVLYLDLVSLRQLPPIFPAYSVEDGFDNARHDANREDEVDGAKEVKGAFGDVYYKANREK